MPEDEKNGSPKTVRKLAARFFRARSFREVEILTARVRTTTIVLGSIGAALVVWFLPDSYPQDPAVVARAKARTALFASRVTPCSAESARSKDDAPSDDIENKRRDDCNGAK